MTATLGEAECDCPTFTSEDQDESLVKLPHKQLGRFVWTSAPISHSVRRRIILSKHPEIEQLYGHDRSQSILAFLAIALQIYVSYYVSVAQLSWFCFLFLCYAVSGTLNHCLLSAMHEAGHKTIFPDKFCSDAFLICTTIPICFPAAIPFKRYHLDHHIYLGVDGMDPDLPTPMEMRLFTSVLGKFIWVGLYPFAYAFRPVLVMPKNVLPIEILNGAINLVVDLSIAYFWGSRAILYLLLGTYFGLSYHPIAGHFIAEHFIWPGIDAYQETFSYYGWWNYLTFNLGYHQEHHDFPRVPGSKLPLLRSIAPEFYATKPHPGWMRTILSFIFNADVSPSNRVVRVKSEGGEVPIENIKSKLHSRKIPFGGKNFYWPRMPSR